MQRIFQNLTGFGARGRESFSIWIKVPDNDHLTMLFGEKGISNATR
jgi:hypothetical protein